MDFVSKVFQLREGMTYLSPAPLYHSAPLGNLSGTAHQQLFPGLQPPFLKTQQVALTMDVPDLDAMMAALETPEASEAEKTDGVKTDTIVFYVEA